MADSIVFSLQNPAAANQAIIYVGQSATLNVTLQNQTGGKVTIQAGGTIEIYMPMYFTDAELQAMSVGNFSQTGWSFSYNAAYNALVLSCANGTSWEENTAFSFEITSVKTDASPATDTVQLNFNGFSGSNLPYQLSAPLALNQPVIHGKADLTDTLMVNLDNQGNLFVSVLNDPLTNTIYLNFKNTGKTALYSGSSMWSGAPKVSVSFVYGATSGSLAPDQKSEHTSVGSAWKISGSIYVDQTEGWGIKNPEVSDQANSPVWELSPNKNNMGIIGAKDQANVTFAFNNIVSLTPVGHTQMYVQFTGFSKDETTIYNDELFVLDITKQSAPLSRGLINFFGPNSIIPIDKPTANIQIPLRWAMYYVDQIHLFSTTPGVPIIKKSYPDASPVDNDNATITIPIQIQQNTAIFFTLQAYDGQGGFLNAIQFTVFIEANFFVDPRDNNKIYPTVFINNQTWMAANLDYYEADGSLPYDRNTGYEKNYGRLYTAAVAKSNIPDGWRLPTQSDWQGLFDALQDAYKTLIAGGSSEFNAQLGGYGDNIPDFQGLGPDGGGYYWSCSADPDTPGSTFFALFYASKSAVNAGNSFPSTYYLSVRYVKNT
jgi:uncharacterized protein (TIGR02145 family)